MHFNRWDLKLCQFTVSELCEIHRNIRWGIWDNRLGQKPPLWKWLDSLYYPQLIRKIDFWIGWNIAQIWSRNHVFDDAKNLILEEWSKLPRSQL